MITEGPTDDVPGREADAPEQQPPPKRRPRKPRSGRLDVVSPGVAYLAQIARPADDVVYPIPVRDWERVIARIERCGRSASAVSYSSVFWGLIGVASSAILGLVSLYASMSPPPTGPLFVFWLTAASSVICAILTHVFSRFHKQEQADHIGLIVEEMRIIAGRFVIPIPVEEEEAP